MREILESCRRVVSLARHIRIDEPAVAQQAKSIDPARLSLPQIPDPLRFHGPRDACANFTLLCDSLNFCFWSDRPWVVTYAGRTWTRTFAMLAGVARAVAEDPTWLTAQRWRDASESDVRRMFTGEGEIPLVAERVRVLNETGERLLTTYAGEFAHLVEQAGFDAASIARLLARDFPSFHDVADYHGEPVAFLKRAQICAADLAAIWSAEADVPRRPPSLSPQSTVLSPLSGLDRLTVFADYRLPQLFRHWGILKLSPTLEDRIESREIIPAGSEAEVEIRAATIVIGDKLSRTLNVPAWRLDYFLWEASHGPEVSVEHHRTPTVYY